VTRDARPGSFFQIVINGSAEAGGTRRKFYLGAMRGRTPHEVVAASYGIDFAVYREAMRR